MKTDTDRFEWLASHLVLFRPHFGGRGYMEWVNGDGETKITEVITDDSDATDLDLLRLAVDEASENFS